MAEARTIGVPTMGTMKTAFGDYAMGAVGGLVYLLSLGIFGSGLIGSLAGPVLAGSVVKGTRGTALATVAGFMGILSMLGGGSGLSGTSTSTDSRGVM